MTKEEMIERLTRRKELLESLKTSLPSGEELLELTTQYGLYTCIEQMCPDTFDTSLPQEWVNNTMYNHGWYPLETQTKVVWAYPKGSVFGAPFPCTREAKQLLERSYPDLLSYPDLT